MARLGREASAGVLWRAVTFARSLLVVLVEIELGEWPDVGHEVGRGVFMMSSHMSDLIRISFVFFIWTRPGRSFARCVGLTSPQDACFSCTCVVAVVRAKTRGQVWCQQVVLGAGAMAQRRNALVGGCAGRCGSLCRGSGVDAGPGGAGAAAQALGVALGLAGGVERPAAVGRTSGMRHANFL